MKMQTFYTQRVQNVDILNRYECNKGKGGAGYGTGNIQCSHGRNIKKTI